MYTPPNQLAQDTERTPGTCRIFSAYVSGSAKTSETELRVTSRALELALAPAYHASTIVRSNPNAVIATTMPITVNAVLSLCRNAFLTTRSGRNMGDRRAARAASECRVEPICSLNYGLRQNRAWPRALRHARRHHAQSCPAIEPMP